MKILKSIAAVLAGFLSVALLSIGTDYIVESLGIFPGVAHPEAYTSWMLAVALIYRTIYSTLGGNITAVLAPDKKQQHVYVLAVLGTIGGIAGVVVGWNLSAHWYPIALALLAFPSVWLGGKMYIKKESHSTQTNLGEKKSDTSNQEITITRIIDASRQKVWDAWTKPEYLSQWFGAPPNIATKETTSIDLRVGGAWSADLVNNNDGTKMPFSGKYLEIQSPVKLVFSIEGPNTAVHETVTVTLTDRVGTTEMTFNQKGHLPPEQYGEPLRNGYNAFFDRMKWTVQQMQ